MQQPDLRTTDLSASPPPMIRQFGAVLDEPPTVTDGKGRTVFGLAVPYDRPTTVADRIDGRRVEYVETFVRGAFADTQPPVPFLWLHDQRAPIGAVQVLSETGRGLEIEAVISRTRAGDEALELVRDGGLRAFSVGFLGVDPPPGTEKPGGRITRRRVRLMEVSLVVAGAYLEAQVGGLRHLAAATARALASDRLRGWLESSDETRAALLGGAGTQMTPEQRHRLLQLADVDLGR